MHCGTVFICLFIVVLHQWSVTHECIVELYSHVYVYLYYTHYYQQGVTHECIVELYSHVYVYYTSRVLHMSALWNCIHMSMCDGFRALVAVSPWLPGDGRQFP